MALPFDPFPCRPEVCCDTTSPLGSRGKRRRFLAVGCRRSCGRAGFLREELRCDKMLCDRCASVLSPGDPSSSTVRGSRVELDGYWGRPISWETARKPFEKEFKDASRAGRPRSVFEVSLAAWRIEPDWKNSRMVEHWQSVIRRFRPLLPDDCYPFHAGTEKVCFQSLQLQDLAQLEMIAGRVAADASIRPDTSDAPTGVYACFADDGCDSLRAALINADAARQQKLAVMDGRMPRTPVVCSSRHTGEAIGTRSLLGLIEYDLPAARRHSERQTLAVIAPFGTGWRACTDQSCAGAAILYEVRRWAELRQAVVVEIEAGSRARLGLLLPAPLKEADRHVGELAAKLHERGYLEWWNDVTQPDGPPLAAQPGQIEFVKFCCEIVSGSNGAAELALLQAQLFARLS
jgi:hypothetical protein